MEVITKSKIEEVKEKVKGTVKKAGDWVEEHDGLAELIGFGAFWAAVYVGGMRLLKDYNEKRLVLQEKFNEKGDQIYKEFLETIVKKTFEEKEINPAILEEKKF